MTELLQTFDARDRWASDMMDGIVRDVRAESAEHETPTHPNEQGHVDFEQHGTHNASGEVVSGVYL